MKKIALIILATAAVAVTAQAKKTSIVETAVTNGSFKTLVTALKSAGLVEALEGDGPFTVFAPSDAAFEDLPKGTVASLLKPENKAKLVSILKYHVVAGKVPSRKAKKLESAETLLGRKLTVKLSNESLFLNESKVVNADIRCSNGIIHVIDKVLIPEDTGSSSVGSKHAIKMAIHVGVSLFNHGNHSACAKLYMKTGNMLINNNKFKLQKAEADLLNHAVSKASGTHCVTTRAWIMRHAFDRILSMK